MAEQQQPTAGPNGQNRSSAKSQAIHRWVQVKTSYQKTGFLNVIIFTLFFSQ
jgi:hypothetical protein